MSPYASHGTVCHWQNDDTISMMVKILENSFHDDCNTDHDYDCNSGQFW